MYKKITLFTALFAVAGFVNQVSAQATATANITATVLTPISIVKVTDMNFGNLSVSGASGSLTLDAFGNRIASGGVSLPVVTGTVSPATFTVSGSGGSTYGITIPGGPITLTSGANTIIAGPFTSNPGPSGTLLLGTQTLSVGAVLTLVANQPAGVYVTATPFPVTVNYN